ncbi:Transcriptional regulator, contains XRE-family HTH domain [Tistlia consotensis]|uniref:Transcriptional regulator, contains XRE-family HTH domain n=1 Tax=Tistlia consotensis USBA 355 TaxID=560819 RepID=A0A1Y6BLJ2_9PROT|nr:helix-turn-helix domain-containing protein [Tistlia consotensis]SMF15854.1 Transcriptional regulator, contains XRE-family HTH domain [Tistlia consotensis USBA 355]SNR41679.1 Transcriptional regulator, contains XRE-family HTH domain [Tistlia consotensis]
MRDELDAEIGRRLREARIVRGMSQTELGDALGITFQQIQKYEKGLNRIGSGRLFKISRILHLPVTYFYDGLEEAASRSPKQPEIEPEEALATKTIRVARLLNELPEGEIKDSVFKLIRSFARAG